MMRSVVRVVFVATSACLAIGCREAACTLVGGESGVWVDATELVLAVETGDEVCLDATCVPLGWSQHLRGQNPAAYTSFVVDEEMSDELSLLVRRGNGEVVAGPSQAMLYDTYPNGKSCPPKLRTASVTVTAQGEIEAQGR